MMRSRWLGYAMATLASLLSWWAYPRVPPRVAVHWNVHGEPDGFGGRLMALALIPAVMLATRGILALLPAIDPRAANYRKFADTYWLIVNGVLAFLLLLHLVIVVNGIGYPVRVDRIAVGGAGLLLVLIGSYLGRVEPNFFFGIRTPWTLSSDTVWRRTNRVGGRILAGGGGALVLTLFLPASALPIVILILAAIAVIPVVLSYIWWKKEQALRGDAPDVNPAPAETPP
ncbi:MAG TPA: SdpI family protein [Gemmatimonadales bacterium]|nr:SdpI family protein [Gemmatimonadales bacterium]